MCVCVCVGGGGLKRTGGGGQTLRTALHTIKLSLQIASGANVPTCWAVI